MTRFDLPVVHGRTASGDPVSVLVDSTGAIATITPIVAPDTPITGAVMPSGGTGIIGWLSAIWKLISDRLMPPGTLTPYMGTANAVNLKASAGVIYAFTCSNNNAAIRYFQIFNKATAPALNDVPFIQFPIYASDGLGVFGQDIFGGAGFVLTTGVSWGFSSTRLTYTAAIASDCTATVRWS